MNEGNMKLRYDMSEDSDSIAENEPDEQMESQNVIPLPKHKRRSYVWRYFNPVPDHSDVYRCTICNETFGNKTANLGRHLSTVHGINDVHHEDAVKKGRPNRSIVWNFCTKLDDKRALCHLCKKVLYFGGGNTSNITKHLRRMHAEKIDEVAKLIPKNMQWGTDPSTYKKERKGSSYVWNFCEKVTKNTVLCKLCNRRMRFHGTANVITHLQRRHNIMDETSSIKTESAENVQDAATSSTNDTSAATRAIQRSISGSLVWKYITRISEDTVHCRVCLKTLSYQGTSNLQRHLHRMHNIVWNGQDLNLPVKMETEGGSDDNSFLDFCESTSDPSILKCQMCDEQFEQNDGMHEVISRHMIKNHGAAMRGEESDEEPAEEDDEIATLYTTVVADEDTTVVGERVEVASPVADDALYNDIIEVEEDLNDIEEVGEHLIEGATGENSLSAPSAENMFSDFSNDSNDAQLVTTTIQVDDTPLMRELKEDLLRQQAMYFSEKAGFYRMQKFLVAQQVKKERLEIERLKASDKAAAAAAAAGTSGASESTADRNQS